MSTTVEWTVNADRVPLRRQRQGASYRSFDFTILRYFREIPTSERHMSFQLTADRYRSFDFTAVRYVCEDPTSERRIFHGNVPTSERRW